jgi:hypothetical protein
MGANSYTNFLTFLTRRRGAAVGLFCQAVELAGDYHGVRPLSASGEEVNKENVLRETIGKSLWPNESIRKVFCAAQEKLPGLYAAVEKAEAEQAAT